MEQHPPPAPSDSAGGGVVGGGAAGGDALLAVTFDLAAGAVLFEWARAEGGALLHRARLGLAPGAARFFRVYLFELKFEPVGIGAVERCGATPTSIHAMLRRVRKATSPVAAVRIGVRADTALGPVAAGAWHEMFGLAVDHGWKSVAQLLAQFAARLEPLIRGDEGADEPAAARAALRAVAATQLGVVEPAALAALAPRGLPGPRAQPAALSHLELRIMFDTIACRAELVWRSPASGATVATGVVTATEAWRLRWELHVGHHDEPAETCAPEPAEVRRHFGAWITRFRTALDWVHIAFLKQLPGASTPVLKPEPPFESNAALLEFIDYHLTTMARERAYRHSPLGRMQTRLDAEANLESEAFARRKQRKEERRVAEEARREATIARLAEERRQREERAAAQRAAEAAAKAAAAKTAASAAKVAAPTPPAAPRAIAPPPPVPVVVRAATLALQDTVLPLTDLRGFALREQAARWWVSNQSDDLLCLPHCRIERLEYQVRTALRVLGALRGRALLSDEVGLGKTIEAGLVAKELFTRGMVKRMLVLTLPSLVDQWAEELEGKFALTAVTTNGPLVRDDPAKFWRDHACIVASLHTLKQPAHLAIAREVHWDLLVVDEAHYLRNRTSQAWQAVNVLPRQFLLLLTATPVQNSLEELYNLVTLLQPGQLPTPKEFRARFLDPERPRQPREPEELRRLLGQVMIRNTRANAGIDLPPRRAETVLFAPEAAEARFWAEWESEFRARLATLSASQSSLWGRLLLQAAGSSPAAWRGALEKFPDQAAARVWRERAPLEASWQRKCRALLPLTREPGGAVVFTQFLDTQAALAEFLRGAGVATFVINGGTPAPERQPITEEFRRRGGALLLTHSGTEGRNLQFCHTLANFDLPWNPMEIEQRIGRLHRLGQREPVAIHNFVQAGTLQEHLLQVLQEKLNLFELVVGETGLVLGERFSGDEFEEEIFRRWHEGAGRVPEAIAGFGAELAEARARHAEVKRLDETLFARDFESQ
jgi:superfamily II DNA or RNA helicase